MGLDRRTFLQRAGISLMIPSIWGGIMQNKSWFDAYGETLAQTTSRKLALLIGINHYPDGDNLRGCLTDVELQRELLIYRFGFNPKDILILTEDEATREAIETAFGEHLVTQATDNDVVIFHFSGYGRQVQLKSPPSDNSPTLVNSLIPKDGILTVPNQTIANDILLDTLLSLGLQVATDKLTIVLDTSYQKPTPSVCTKLWLRSYTQSSEAIISTNELIFAEQLQSKLKNNLELQLTSRKIPGLILDASQDSIATEIVSHNFNAGLFTYCLTQYLWECIPPTNIWMAMHETASNVALHTANGQRVNLNINSNQNIFPYYLMPSEELRGEALVTRVGEGNLVDLDLVGLPILVLANYGVNSCFQTYGDQLTTTKVQLNSLEGRKAKATILDHNNQLQPGLVLRESIRVLLRNLGLNVGLDSKLERIERVDATSTLSSISEVASAINIGEDFADCILGKLPVNSSSSETYGLLSPAGVLFPHTMGKNANEAVSSAVRRLHPQLKTLLASKLLNLTINQNSSRLPVRISLEIKTNEIQSLIYKQTLGSKENPVNNAQQNPIFLASQKDEKLVIDIPVGSKISLKITNESQNDMYVLLLGINSSGKAMAYFFPEFSVISAGESNILSENSSPLKWVVNAAKGLGQLILICSQSPFNETLLKLYDSTPTKLDREEIVAIDEPVIISKTLLQDLHQGSKVSSNLINNLTDVYALDINTWVTFSFVYQII